MVERSLRFIRGFLLSYGPESLKRRMWDTEYRHNVWPMRHDTSGDPVYRYLEKYARNGSILDLGCGSGNTCTELRASAYQDYLGVDISAAAIEKAIRCAEAHGRDHKNRFVCSDFLRFESEERFDVILFRESVYHVPWMKLRGVLDRYAGYLKDHGAFILTVYTTALGSGRRKRKPNAILHLLDEAFEVVERCESDCCGNPAVVVFRPVRACTSAAPEERQEEEQEVFAPERALVHEPFRRGKPSRY